MKKQVNLTYYNKDNSKFKAISQNVDEYYTIILAERKSIS